jgi:hypothetical protein
VHVFNKTLTAEEVRALYNNNLTDVFLINAEPDEIWRVCTVINNGINDGPETCRFNIPAGGSNPSIEGLSLAPLNRPGVTNIFNHEIMEATYNSSNPLGIPNKDIESWYVNQNPIMTLNMPFERSNSDNENSWTKDYSGSENHAYRVTANWQKTGGRDGFGAYQFDGETTNIEVVSEDFMTPEATWSGWIQRFNSPSLEYVFGYGTFSTSRFMVYVDDGDLIIYDDILNEGERVQIATDVLPEGEWHHLAIVFNADGSKIVYLDGNFVGIDTTGGTLAQITSIYTPKFYIGSQVSVNNPFNGMIDDVRIFNRALSSSQIDMLVQDQMDMIMPPETTVGDEWQVCVTPNDGYSDGTEVCSNTLTVI